jgi:hypothetical protein
MSLEDYLARDWAMLVGREHGPLGFRMILQPLVAAALAIRAGRRDAKNGRKPFGWALITDSSQRHGLLKEGWRDVGRLYGLAVVVDGIYQVLVFGTVHVFQALIVAAILAFPTYVILRGATNRIVRGVGTRG